MDDGEFAELLALGHERQGVEFKGPGPRTDNLFFAMVARAVLGMSNRRDGGFVILGVEEVEKQLNPVGLSPDALRTWTYDDVAAALAGYADPSVSFDLENHSSNGAQFIVLTVYEFEDVPVLCAKDFSGPPNILRKGACYVRSRRKPETSEIPSQEDMRDLLDLATEKRLKKWVAQAQAAGLIQWQAVPANASDEESFRRQIEGLT